MEIVIKLLSSVFIVSVVLSQDHWETAVYAADELAYQVPESGAADKIKMKLYYDAINKWAIMNNVSCIYFEAFNEPWKSGELGS